MMTRKPNVKHTKKASVRKKDRAKKKNPETTTQSQETNMKKKRNQCFVSGSIFDTKKVGTQ